MKRKLEQCIIESPQASLARDQNVTMYHSFNVTTIKSECAYIVAVVLKPSSLLDRT